MSDALIDLLPDDDVMDAAVASGSDLPAVLVLRWDQLFVATLSFEEASAPAVEVEVSSISQAFASLAAKRDDQVQKSVGGVAVVSMRHRWTLRLTTFGRKVCFEGDDVRRF
jgi:hypothetical protein